VAAVPALSLPAAALADEVLDRCVDANTHAQALHREGRLVEARQELMRCADPSCPRLVRDDCTQLLDDLDRAQPTIVFDVKDDAGHDLTEVKVQIDGRPFTDLLNGVALIADPGAHVFTFEAAGRRPATQQVVVREGEKNRRESVVLKNLGSSVPAGGGAPAPNRSASTPRGSSEGSAIQKVGALVAGGLGVAALALGGALAALAKSKSDDANAFCPDVRCSNGHALNMNREALTLGNAATVAVVSGAAGVVAGAVLWLTARSSSSQSGVAVVLSGNAVGVRGTW